MRDQSVWTDRRLIFSGTGGEQDSTHAQCPIPIRSEGGNTTFIYSSRDKLNRTRPFCVSLDENLKPRSSGFDHQSLLDVGCPGAFDDMGVMPSCVVQNEGTNWIYYIGWNVSSTVPYRNSIGIAVAPTLTGEWRRLFDGPLMDRSPIDPYFCATPFVLRDSGVWRMWYLSCREWRFVEGRLEPRYLLRYAESKDGLDWKRQPRDIIAPIDGDEALARPWIIRTQGRYQMWFCYRAISGYRTSRSRGYRIGYAESSDGMCWERNDEKMGMVPSSGGWDDSMVAYPSVVPEDAGYRMFYNGNEFGRYGFGTAFTPCTA